MNVGGVGAGQQPADDFSLEVSTNAADAASAAQAGAPTPVLPRTGFADTGVLSALQVRAKLALDALEGAAANWRTGAVAQQGGSSGPSGTPVVRPMYGMFGPHPTPSPAPAPTPHPIVRPMYGMFGPHPTPSPAPTPGPIARPMYGVVAPHPTPAPGPIARPMYGVVAPQPQPGPIARPMYGVIAPMPTPVI